MIKLATGLLTMTLLSSYSFAHPDTVLYNANLIPMTGENHRAQAIAIKDGVIIQIGDNESVMATKGDMTLLRDMDGKTITPGFIDAHGHFANFIPLANSLFVYPSPMGSGDSIAAIKEQVRAFLADESLDTSPLQLGFGYDDSVLAEKRHLLKTDLDPVTGDFAMCVMHISGHLASCNSKALKVLNYDKDTPDPAGGVIQRDANGELTGLLEESATYALFPHLTVSGKEEALANLEKAQQMFLSYGVTTAQEGLATKETLALMKLLADSNALELDILAYAKWLDFEAALEMLPLSEYYNGLKLAGMKITGDGSPQGKTAYLSTPYVEPPTNQPFHYHGYPVLEQQEMDRYVDLAFKHNAQLISHANGDAAADLLLNAVQKANQTYPDRDHRTTMIHAQTVRLDQVKRMQQEGLIASYFPAHTFFWGDFHRESVLGEWRASNISPTGWAEEFDLTYTIHMDAPVAFPDQLLNMWTAVNRVSRSGVILGEVHKISPYQALEAITKTAAFQNFEEQHKGTLEPGKLADLVVLNADPLAVKPMKIKEVLVLETIKQGNTVYLHNPN